ncbi:MAG: hypothetical protein LBV72_09815 [Tannerella sp.]|nr:hypothetical protein [Tannerella sp.]
MIKLLSLLLAVVFLFTSCKSTYYVNNQRLLKNKYINTPVKNVLSDFGEPNEIEERTFGQSYVYYFTGKENKGSDPVEQYTRFNIDKDGFVIDVKSTATVETRRVSVGKTIGISLLGIVVIGALAGMTKSYEK